MRIENPPQRTPQGGSRERGREEVRRWSVLIEWLDAFVYDHQGLMLILDITFIVIAIVCTLINVRVLLH